MCSVSDKASIPGVENHLIFPSQEQQSKSHFGTTFRRLFSGTFPLICFQTRLVGSDYIWEFRANILNELFYFKCNVIIENTRYDK